MVSKALILGYYCPDTFGIFMLITFVLFWNMYNELIAESPFIKKNPLDFIIDNDLFQKSKHTIISIMYSLKKNVLQFSIDTCKSTLTSNDFVSN